MGSEMCIRDRNQWTFTIIRTEKGEEIVKEAEKNGLIRVKEIEEDSFPMKLLLRLSRNKRKRGMDKDR